MCPGGGLLQRLLYLPCPQQLWELMGVLQRNNTQYNYMVVMCATSSNIFLILFLHICQLHWWMCTVSYYHYSKEYCSIVSLFIFCGSDFYNHMHILGNILVEQVTQRQNQLFGWYLCVLGGGEGGCSGSPKLQEFVLARQSRCRNCLNWTYFDPFYIAVSCIAISAGSTLVLWKMVVFILMETASVLCI